MASAKPQHWVVWDGACDLCAWSVAQLRHRDTEGRFQVVPFQSAPPELLQRTTTSAFRAWRARVHGRWTRLAWGARCAVCWRAVGLWLADPTAQRATISVGRRRGILVNRAVARRLEPMATSAYDGVPPISEQVWRPALRMRWKHLLFVHWRVAPPCCARSFPNRCRLRPTTARPGSGSCRL